MMFAHLDEGVDWLLSRVAKLLEVYGLDDVWGVLDPLHLGSMSGGEFVER